MTVIASDVQAWAQLAGISSTAAYGSGKVWRQLWGADAGQPLGEPSLPSLYALASSFIGSSFYFLN